MFFASAMGMRDCEGGVRGVVIDAGCKSLALINTTGQMSNISKSSQGCVVDARAPTVLTEKHSACNISLYLLISPIPPP